MSTKSNRSSGTQHNARGVTQGNTLVDPVTGLPVDVIEDSQGTRRLAVDANITAQIPQLDIDTTYEEDSIAIGDPNTDTLLKINPDGSIDSNIEIDAADGDNVAITSPTTGNTIEPNPDGSINVNLIDSVGTIITSYDEVLAVASATLTTIQTYSVPPSTTAFLQKISTSGTNIAEYQIEINSIIYDKRRTWFNGSLNLDFEFSFTKNGLPLVAGDTVTVRVIHNRPNTGDFNSRIQVLEV